MTNSDQDTSLKEIIKHILKITSEEYLWAKIDEPIREASIIFKLKKPAKINHQTLIHIAGNFVQHIYKYGLPIKLNLSKKQADAEALSILEAGYQNPYPIGYYGALLDAIDTNQDGLELVLEQITESIIQKKRQTHINWAYNTLIHSLSWEDKSLLSEILLKEWGPFLPPNILNCHPSQFADTLPELIDTIRSINNIIYSTMRLGSNLTEIS